MNKTKSYDMLCRLQAIILISPSSWSTVRPFELLIAVLLSAQATDVSLNKATRLLFPVANTPQAMLAGDGGHQKLY